jgi:NitT/TauT family transport system substrate-binding protein
MLLRIIRPLLVAALLPLLWARPAAAETITVTHWGSAFYGAPYAVAMAKGYFKNHGVDITGILTSTGGGTSVRNTLAGGLPYGEVALSAAMEAIAAGQPLKIISGGVDTVADILWIAKPDSPLHSVKDLKGKRVGYTEPGSVTNMLILMALKANGMTANDVHLIAAGGIGANLSAVLNNAIDTGMTGEPVWSENKGKVQAVFWVKDVLPPAMMQTVGITTTAFAKAHPETLRGLIEARREGVQFIEAHPDEAADITAKAFHGDPKLYREVFHNFVKIHYWSDGKLDYDGMNRMAQGLEIIGKQKGPVDWTKLVDASLLPKDMQQAAK